MRVHKFGSLSLGSDTAIRVSLLIRKGLDVSTICKLVSATFRTVAVRVMLDIGVRARPVSIRNQADNPYDSDAGIVARKIRPFERRVGECNFMAICKIMRPRVLRPVGLGRLNWWQRSGNRALSSSVIARLHEPASDIVERFPFGRKRLEDGFECQTFCSSVCHLLPLIRWVPANISFSAFILEIDLRSDPAAVKQIVRMQSSRPFQSAGRRSANPAAAHCRK